jgi:hypothetical protein
MPFLHPQNRPSGPQSTSVTLGTCRRAPRRVRMLPAGSHSPPRSGGSPPGSSVATDGDSGFAQWDSNFTVSTVKSLSYLNLRVKKQLGLSGAFFLRFYFFITHLWPRGRQCTISKQGIRTVVERSGGGGWRVTISRHRSCGCLMSRSVQRTRSPSYGPC